MKTIDDLNNIRTNTLKKLNPEKGSNKTRIVVGMGTCGIASGANKVYDTFIEFKNKHNLDNVDIIKTGCIGVCMYEPMAEIYHNGDSKVTYIQLNDDSVCEIMNKHVLNNQIAHEYTIGSVINPEVKIDVS